MKLIALVFAILAAVPQALKWMAYFFAKKLGDCTLPAKECLIKDNDQADILNKIYGPNWFTTTGLWIGLGGFIVFFVAWKVMDFLENRKVQRMVDKGVNQANGGGTVDREGRHIQARGADEASYGRMPRPPAFDKYGRPRK